MGIYNRENFDRIPGWQKLLATSEQSSWRVVKFTGYLERGMHACIHVSGWMHRCLSEWVIKQACMDMCTVDVEIDVCIYKDKI